MNSVDPKDKLIPEHTCWRFASLYGSCDSMVVDLAVLHLAKSLRTSSHELHVPTVQVKHVRAGIHLTQVSVGVEGMQSGGPTESLRRYSLDDVSLDNVLL